MITTVAEINNWEGGEVPVWVTDSRNIQGIYYTDSWITWGCEERNWSMIVLEREPWNKFALKCMNLLENWMCAYSFDWLKTTSKCPLIEQNNITVHKKEVV